MENGRRYIQGKTGINVQKRERYKNGPTLGGNPKAHLNETMGVPENSIIVTEYERIVYEGRLSCPYCTDNEFRTEHELFEHLNSVHLRRRSIS
jgi:hypothetical protein